jgi:hypothetical protein
MSSTRIRAFAPQDAAAAAELHARVYPDGPWPSVAACAAYFRDMLFHNPWHDPEMPSWVAEKDGRMVGFLCVLPRGMLFGERRIRVAVGCQFMVDPGERRSLVALQLLKKYFAGPQDLSLADGANDSSRRLWEASGGICSPLHALHWTRLLRPAQGLWQLAAERHRLRALGRLGAPLAALADSCLGLFGTRPHAGLREEALDARALCEALHQARSAFTLRPHYDAASLEWLLAQAKARRRHGALQSALARDEHDRVAGWFMYYLNGATSQVLQVGARREQLPAVLECLFHHARSRGAVALEGRMEPHLAAALHGRRCFLQARSIATLLHAREPSLLMPFLRGDVLFTRLEGEWWMRFADGPAPAPAGRRRARHKQKLASAAAA